MRVARTTGPLRVLALAAALALAGCGGGSSTSGSATTPAPGSSPSGSSSGAARSGTITVLAAASLKESFTAIGKAFEQANPGTTVTFSFGPSSGLAQQITQGAPADVFASASQKNMQQVVDAKAADSPAAFGKNVLEIAVPRDNPAKTSRRRCSRRRRSP
jgi:molybdate transport system substrate-binding protein